MNARIACRTEEEEEILRFIEGAVGYILKEVSGCRTGARASEKLASAGMLIGRKFGTPQQTFSPDSLTQEDVEEKVRSALLLDGAWYFASDGDSDAGEYRLFSGECLAFSGPRSSFHEGCAFFRPAREGGWFLFPESTQPKRGIWE